MRPGIETLQSLPFLANFPPDWVAKLNEAADFVRVGPNEIVAHIGEEARDLHVLVGGFIAAIRAQVVIDVFGPVTPLCLSPALQGLPLPITLQTITSARLVSIPAAILRVMISDAPRLALPFLEHSLKVITELTEADYALKQHSVPRRLAVHLLSLVTDSALCPARFVLPYEKRFLAGKIGCSRENLSRAFASLRPLGVTTVGRVVVLNDVLKLRNSANYQPPRSHTTQIREQPLLTRQRLCRLRMLEPYDTGCHPLHRTARPAHGFP